MNRHAWTAAEDATLRRHYPRSPSACAAMLPRHSRGAVAQRACKLGIKRGRTPWTREEDAALVREWGKSRRLLTERFRPRSWGAIVSRARTTLGLPPPQRGMVSIAEAVRRTGYCDAALRAILARRGVEIEVYHGGHGDAAHRRVPHYRVDFDDVREAVEAELRDRAADTRETLAEAAARVGVHEHTLLRYLRSAGLHNPPARGGRSRYAPSTIDEAMAHAAGLHHGGLAAVCEREGVPYQTAWRYARAAGLVASRRPMAPPVAELVVRAVLARRAALAVTS